MVDEMPWGIESYFGHVQESQKKATRKVAMYKCESCNMTHACEIIVKVGI